MSCNGECTETTSTTNCNYDNCGCLNPTTFNCTTYSGANLTYVGNKDDDGDVILDKINDSFIDLYGNKGKLSVDENDSCPEYLYDKLEAGLNISFQITGTGCDRKIRIDSVTGGVAVDVNVRASANDTVSGYLGSKLDSGTYTSKTIINPSGNERVKIDVVPTALLSSDAGNMLGIGSDGGIKTTFNTPDGSETKLIQGSGATVTGTGTELDPYIISTNPSIQARRTCFDGIWRDVSLASITNVNISVLAGKVQYRYRHDGTIEYKGSMTFNVIFGNYASTNRKHTITLGDIPVSCVTLSEQAGTSDLKGINYIDVPQASADQITQTYGYIIRKSAQNLILEFQSSFTNNTTKTIVVNFDGAVSHPNI